LLIAVLSVVVVGLVAASPKLSIVAEVPGSTHQLTGVAVSDSGRVFVNFPRWNAPDAISVAELKPVKGSSHQVTVVPYPNDEINQFDSSSSEALSLAGSHLVCVQAVVMDRNDHLWILDTGSPYLAGVISPDAPKLLKVDITKNKVLRVYHFDDSVALNSSYLNDVRFDERRHIAYITDSEASGAIVVLDLISGRARRLLAGTAQTMHDPDFVAHIGDFQMTGTTNSDGIALSRDKKTLFFQALDANHLFSIKTKYLRNECLTSEELEAHVVAHGKTTMTDGMEADQLNRVYFSAIERFAISRCSLTPDLECEDVVEDPRIKWPDSFSWRGNTLYFTTSQIFLGPQFHNGTDLRTDPYRVWKIDGLFSDDDEDDALV